MKQTAAKGGSEMRDRWIVACLPLFVAGCASTTISEAPPTITIDISRLRAISPQWESDLVDCSDSLFRCFEAPGHFLLAFPRTCPTDNLDLMVQGYRFQYTAPAPHYSHPSGGYVSHRYPHVHLYYISDSYRYLDIRSAPVLTDNWGGSSVAGYSLDYVGEVTPFRCS
ncbi:hypothetical protein [Brevundimonas sp. GCM10030266]|uniref:hypothetical protein n=1 Tax=Brevundimonas sp. GCM10030266 TaxID=3273386 RepID=UPI003618406B